MVQEVVGLCFQRIGADGDNRVGKFGVLVAIVELPDAHVTRAVHLGVIGRTVVDADVLDLHRTEVELSGAPGIFVTAGGTAVVEHRNKEAILALLGDYRRGHAGNQIQRVIPTCRLHGTVAPHHRVGKSLQLSATLLRRMVLSHPRAADGAKSRIYHAVDVRLDHELDVLTILFDNVVHRRRVPCGGLGRLLLRQVDGELV